MTPHGADQGEHRDLELDSTFQRDDWPERLRTAVAETLAARQARRDLRTQLAERRDHGLERRHAEKLGRSHGDPVSDVRRRTGTAADATGPTTESQVETPSPEPALPRTGTAKLGQPATAPLESSQDRSQEVDPPPEPDIHIPDAQAATLARLRRAGQGGWRPTRPETEN